MSSIGSRHSSHCACSDSRSGREDIVDHDELRLDPVIAVPLGKLDRAVDAPAPLAGKNTLDRLKHAGGLRRSRGDSK
jgi:hypothetical protein